LLYRSVIKFKIHIYNSLSLIGCPVKLELLRSILVEREAAKHKSIATTGVA
jgi:hypothetical protein